VEQLLHHTCPPTLDERRSDFTTRSKRSAIEDLCWSDACRGSGAWPSSATPTAGAAGQYATRVSFNIWWGHAVGMASRGFSLPCAWIFSLIFQILLGYAGGAHQRCGAFGPLETRSENHVMSPTSWSEHQRCTQIDTLGSYGFHHLFHEHDEACRCVVDCEQHPPDHPEHMLLH